MSNVCKLSSVPVVSTPAEYDAVLERVTVAESEAIEGVRRTARFEELLAPKVQSLGDWYKQNGELVLLRIDSLEMALHLKGATEVDPSKDAWNYKRGSGKDATYYWCSRNTHNRRINAANKGDLTKQGLIFDMVNQYFVPGPVGHIDAYGVISSLQHRIDAAIDVFDLTGTFPTIEIFTFVGLPPSLNATIDRGAPKDSKAQEFIDPERFTLEQLSEWMEYLPDPDRLDLGKLRDTLTKTLVTVRNNLFSRMQGTGYHPAKRDQPSTRQALALEKSFVDGPEALFKLIVEVYEAEQTESGGRALWAKSIQPSMVVTAIVLASNADNDDKSAIVIDEDIKSTILSALGVVSDDGHEGLSDFVREVARLRKQPKKPSGIERWVFWGLVHAVSDLLNSGSLEVADGKDCTSYIPNVTDTLKKRIKNGKEGVPCFGGLDIGVPESKGSDDSED